VGRKRSESWGVYAIGRAWLRRPDALTTNGIGRLDHEGTFLTLIHGRRGGDHRRGVTQLDNLQLAVWQKAMAGDVPSAIAAVRCIMSRCRLLGLDGPGLLREEPQPRTLVVPPVT
jgi:hypothetical protein